MGGWRNKVVEKLEDEEKKVKICNVISIITSDNDIKIKGY